MRTNAHFWLHRHKNTHVCIYTHRHTYRYIDKIKLDLKIKVKENIQGKLKRCSSGRKNPYLASHTLIALQ